MKYLASNQNRAERLLRAKLADVHCHPPQRRPIKADVSVSISLDQIPRLSLLFLKHQGVLFPPIASTFSSFIRDTFQRFLVLPGREGEALL